MGKKYALLQRKVENLESQLIPILATPPDPETMPAHHPIPKGINQQLLFINNLLTTEIALSPASDEAHCCHLAQIARRVRLLQSTLQKWAEAKPNSASIEPGSASMCSCTESCLADADEDEDEDGYCGEGEESPLLGFTVYDNPEFFGTFDGDAHDDDDLEFVDGDNSNLHDDDDDDRNDEEEYDAINQEEGEEEMIEIVDQKEESREMTEDEEKDDNLEDYEGTDEEEEQQKIWACDEKEEGDEEREYNCFFRAIFGIIMVGMGFIFLMIGFSDFSDHYQPAVFLAPT